MKLSEDMKETAGELIDAVDLEDEDLVSRGMPEKGAKAGVDEEQWLESWVDGTVREVVRYVVQASIDDREEGEMGPMTALRPENVERVYVSQYPWRCPFMAVELEECPGYARITETTEAYIRTHPAHSGEWDACRFQVREA